MSSDTCPPLYDYTPTEQAAAAEALMALPEGSILTRMIADYGAVREAIRACRG